ncbi:SUF system Fe-S cluster assembly regulator [Pontiella agarivorans]|uniref:SUF system Fe-S cluster assembly regulator n=1 Tax=Pontiella agarivorans TaxID=3038953 RepID=A0ABU5MTL7_9BACT|nr:SUF system Fe-S cluster assembly regulator [Pontiella agarivorans]MDZ8117487.1 SUF system Fe-S cluster assembly regulator [Pontiella agarivorans]
MLRITKITDYGFILLAHMAKAEKDQLHNAKDLSAAIGIPLPTVSKVLKILTQGHILKSHQGSKGGYSLSKTADQITAAEIIEAVEGPVAITDCSSAEGCERNCPISPSWQRVNDAVLGALNGLTLGDMADGGSK